jgi:hypothetical protein
LKPEFARAFFLTAVVTEDCAEDAVVLLLQKLDSHLFEIVYIEYFSELDQNQSTHYDLSLLTFLPITLILTPNHLTHDCFPILRSLFLALIRNNY